MAKTEKGRKATDRYRTDPEYRRQVREKQNAWARANPEKARKWRTRFMKANPDKRIAYTRKYKYGVTKEQFEAMVEAQGGKCPICTNDLCMGKGTHLDHCHATGKFRGVLCTGCNAGLGMFKENPLSLERAIGYLQKERAK